MSPNHLRLAPGSWLAYAATGGRRITAVAHAAPSIAAGASPRTLQPPYTRFRATRSSSGTGDDSSCSSSDGWRPNFNRLFSKSAATLTSSGSADHQSKTSLQQTHIFSAEPWSVDEGERNVDAMEAERGREKAGQEEEQAVMKAVSSGAGLWASRGMLAGAAMLYGTDYGCVKLIEETVPISLATALRFTAAVIPFLPFLIKINPGVFRAGVEIGLFDAVGFWAQSKSLTTTAASKVAFISSLSVIVVPIMDTVFGAADEETEKKAQATEVAYKKCQGVVLATLNGPWLPALLAVVGVACLELFGVDSRPNTGDAWALLQPLSFGIVFWLTERSTRKYPGDTLGMVAAHLLTVAFLAIGWCARAGQFPMSFKSLHETVLQPSASLAVPLSLLWVGLVTTSVTVFLETLAMEKVSAAESAVIYSSEPIWGTAFAAMLLGETIGWNTGIGAVLIILACGWSSVGLTIQSKVLSFMAAVGTGGMNARVKLDDDDSIEIPQVDRHQSVGILAPPL